MMVEDTGNNDKVLQHMLPFHGPAPITVVPPNVVRGTIREMIARRDLVDAVLTMEGYYLQYLFHPFHDEDCMLEQSYKTHRFLRVFSTAVSECAQSLSGASSRQWRTPHPTENAAALYADIRERVHDMHMSQREVTKSIMGSLAMQMGEADLAIEHLRDALESRPELIVSAKLLGDAYHQTKQPRTPPPFPPPPGSRGRTYRSP
mmetsp:Transcript_13656/g.38813  ORF Transcript_13656/g.38813 Transcript_13656/m.38813 type:complete len:204 (-) Transcript_13656:401-1012(-)